MGVPQTSHHGANSPFYMDPSGYEMQAGSSQSVGFLFFLQS